MAKLTNIVKQLSEKDFQSIHDSLIENNAEKSAYLLKAFRERKLSDGKIMAELGVTANAYYTLRSRLNQKIEEHLLEQMESPRTDILRKVANLNEVLFTKKRTISVATLNKLEKELIDYDLANELTIVYKSLKKININSPDYFTYSQLYNRHVAYMLAVDKAEDLLAEYFKKYGSYLLSADENEKMGLILLMKEMQNVAHLYESHRLYVYQSCMLIHHRLFVEPDDSLEGESIEDILGNVQKIFDNYKLDPLYFHLNLVFEFLKLEYYSHYRVYKEAEKYFEEVNDAITNLLVNYPNYTFSVQVLITKMERSLRLGKEKELYEENKSLFIDYEPDPLDVPRHTIYSMYLALSCYYAGKFEEAAKIINELLNVVSLKKCPFVQMEVKTVLALQYCMLNDFDLFNQLANSIQRQIRMFGKQVCENILVFIKILRVAVSESQKDKKEKIASLAPKFQAARVSYYSPTSMIRMDEKFIKNIISLT